MAAGERGGARLLKARLAGGDRNSRGGAGL
jgi:hypothetical protein